MGKVTLTVSNTPYQFSCRDGEEARLQDLAAIIDAKVAALSQSLGRVGDTKLLLMASLLLLDEASEAQSKNQSAQTDLTAHVGALDDLATEIETIAARLESA